MHSFSDLHNQKETLQDDGFAEKESPVDVNLKNETVSYFLSKNGFTREYAVSKSQIVRPHLMIRPHGEKHLHHLVPPLIWPKLDVIQPGLLSPQVKLHWGFITCNLTYTNRPHSGPFSSLSISGSMSSLILSIVMPGLSYFSLDEPWDAEAVHKST